MSHAMMALITDDENDEPVASRYCIRIEDFVVTLMSPISASRTPESDAWSFPSRSLTFSTGEPCPASGSTWPGPAPGALHRAAERATSYVR
jgi:hypothetical protein